MSEAEYLDMAKWGFWLGVPAHVFYYFYLPYAFGLKEDIVLRVMNIVMYSIFYAASFSTKYRETSRSYNRYAWIGFGAVQFIILPRYFYVLNNGSSLWHDSFVFCLMAMILFLKSFDIFLAALFGFAYILVFMSSPSEPESTRNSVMLIGTETICVGGIAMLYIRSLQRKLKGKVRDLEQSYSMLQEYDVKKDDFIASVVHEIRTPLSVATIAVEDIIADKNTDKLPTHVGRLKHALSSIKTQVSDLIELERLNTLDTIRPIIVDVDTWIRSLSPRLGMLCREKSLWYKCIMLPGITCSFDPDKLETVLNNLVSNAAKFTPFGGRVFLRVSVDSSSSLIFEVQDSGSGITQEDILNIFNKYYQAPRHQNQAMGVGIGLSLVKKIVLEHDGHISVTSNVTGSIGSGSTFKITLGKATCLSSDFCVVDAFSPNQPIEANDNHISENPSSVVVYVVEDNNEVRNVLKTHLRDIGFRVFVFRSAHDVLQAQAMDVPRPDIVITDMNLPGMSGFDLMLALRISGMNAPFIYLTAHTRISEMIKPHRDAYVVEKPFVYSDLDNMINGALYMHGKP